VFKIINIIILPVKFPWLGHGYEHLFGKNHHPSPSEISCTARIKAMVKKYVATFLRLES
jgi:hypothetical protein